MESKIDGLKIIHKKQIVDERGKIMHMLKATDEEFIQFGEIYFSTAWPGVVKAWHVHTQMTVNNFVIKGHAKLVIADIRQNSATYGAVQEIFLGDDNRVLVQIPPLVANGYKAYGDQECILANCATIPHEPNEMLRIDPVKNDIDYDWGVQNG